MPTCVPIQIIFLGVFLLTGRTADDQITPAPISLDDLHDPESLCASRPISRSASVFALPGFGYMPGMLSSIQLASPRYVRLEEPADMLSSSGMARYDSMPSFAYLDKPPKLSLSAASADSSPDSSALVRGQSVPMMDSPHKHHQLDSGSPHSTHGALFSSKATAANFSIFNTPVQPSQRALDAHIAAMHTTNAESAPSAAGRPMLGAFAPIAVSLQATASDLLAQLSASVLSTHSQTAQSDNEHPVHGSLKSDSLSR